MESLGILVILCATLIGISGLSIMALITSIFILFDSDAPIYIRPFLFLISICILAVCIGMVIVGMNHIPYLYNNIH